MSRSVLLRLVVAGAVAIGAAIVFVATRGMSRAEIDALAASPWAGPALAALYLVMFAFGTPGSWLFVASGFVFAPPAATLIAVVGGTLGSLAAHGIGRWLGADAREGWRARAGFRAVERSLDLPGLTAIRLVPFFPHSIVNFGSGIAGARIPTFLVATIIGIGVKAYVYSSVTHRASRAQDPFAEVTKPEVWGLLLGLAVLSLGAKWLLDRRLRSLAAGGERADDNR